MKENKRKNIYLKSTAGAALLSLGILFFSNTGGHIAPNRAEYIDTRINEGSTYGQAYNVTDNAINYGIDEYARAQKINYNLPGIPSRYLSSYKTKAVVLGNTELSTRAPIINGIVYVSVEDICKTVAGARVTYNKNTKTLHNSTTINKN